MMMTSTKLATRSMVNKEGVFDEHARLLETYIVLRLQEQEQREEVEQGDNAEEIRTETQRYCDVMRTGTLVLQHDCRSMMRLHRSSGAVMSDNNLRCRHLLALSQEAMSQLDIYQQDLAQLRTIVEIKRCSDGHHSYMRVILDDMAQVLGEPQWTGVH